MDDATAQAVMARFASAYFKRDARRLAEAVTPDAEWHFAFGGGVPNGRVRRGIEGFLQGIAENDALFERLRFDDVAIRPFGEDQIVMTYLANGRYREGDDFALRGVELITVRDGRLALKDVFWKQTT
jgi:ketosteroid isomerase-like protein